MKIKRFEAESMSDALRMIKKEFGEEAVILSAKTVKKSGGLLGTSKNRQVVVTAAIDRSAGSDSCEADKMDDAAVSQPLSAAASPAMAGTFSSAGAALNRIVPITRTGRQKLRSKFVRLEAESQPTAYSGNRQPNPLRHHLAQAGVCAAISEELIKKAALLVSADEASDSEWRAALSEVIAAKGWVAPLRSNPRDQARIVVLTGPSGVGKTTTAAKLAADAALQGRRVVLLSLDNHRVAGTAALDRYARIIGVPLHTADEPRRIAQVMEQHADTALFVIDTPGINPREPERRDRLVRLLAGVKTKEVHLLVNAAAQEKSLGRAVAFFKPLDVQRLLFTQLDWTEEMGLLLDVLDRYKLPVTYISDGPRVPDDLKAATAEWVTHLIWPLEGQSEGVAAATAEWKRNAQTEPDDFVANRNSDIFHRRSCRAVQRINSDNVKIFPSQIEALGQEFKPCRMCCSDLLVSQPFDRLAHRPAASNRSHAR